MVQRCVDQNVFPQYCDNQARFSLTQSMISSTTWSLTEMCKTHLKSDRQDIDPDDTASYLDGSLSSPERLLTFVRHCELDAHYQMAIASKVQILPLTKQLTNLAGNSW